MSIDVAIIGGGLAGCSSAIRLAQMGFEVTLFEAGTYPRHKVCGEFMSHGCQTHFEAFGVADAMNTMGVNHMHKSLISTPDGTCWEASLPGKAIGISRYQLDSLLSQQAKSLGVEVHTNTKVTAIEGTLASEFIVSLQNREQIQAKTVLGAYGKRSSLDRKLKRPFLKAKQPFVGLKCHFENLPIPDRVELHTFTGGYCGMSEVEAGITNICLLVQEDIFRRNGEGDIQTFIAWMAKQNPLIAERLQQGTPIWERWLSISQVPFVQKSPVHQEIFMLGDAGGMITPLTGDGMEIALQSSEIVTHHIARYLQQAYTAEDLIAQFCQSWQTTFAKRIQVGRFSQFFMFRPQWLKWGLRTFNIAPPLGDFFIHQTRHTDSVTI